MKRILNICVCMFFAFCLLVSCSSNASNRQDKEKLKIGVTSIPHGEILENLRDIFDLDFEIINYIDYEALNNDLLNGKIDGNFFQTREYLNNFNLNSEVKLIELAEVHVEPLIIYSNKYKSVDKVEEGDVIYIPNDPVNRDRALKLLEQANLIKLMMDFGEQRYVVAENPKNLVMNEVEVNSIPSFYNEGDLAVMNTNVALENMIFPHISGIFYENSFSDEDKVNVFVVREDMRTSVKLKEIAHFLNSYETFKFINEKYKGFVKPVF
ncbi:MAG TPA: transporter [Candidatus Dwaynia gallinarum]|nr:transporter [Candidatus Dwaynia gallinarum]